MQEPGLLELTFASRSLIQCEAFLGFRCLGKKIKLDKYFYQPLSIAKIY